MSHHLSIPVRAVVAEPEQGSKVFTRLSARAMPYNAVADIGEFTEDFAPGAFATSLQDRPVVPLFLYHADTHLAPAGTTPHPIGISEQWDDRPDGLYGTWRLDTREDAQLAARMAREGILGYVSIFFIEDPRGSVWQFRDGRRHVTRTKARLISVSLTPSPSYPMATVAAVRHVGDTSADRRRRRRRR